MAEDRPLAIIHVVDTLEFGGLERVVTDIAIAQRTHGHRVGVFSICATQGFRAVLEAAHIDVVIGAKRGTFDLNVLRGLRRLLLKDPIDIVHTHNFVPNYYAVAATLFARRRPRVVNTCHNMGTRLANRRLRWLYRLSLARTARIALVGCQVHDRLVNTGIVAPARARTVLNGVAVERFASTAESRDVARAALDIAPDELLVGCVGRLVELKNHRLLLTCAAGLVATWPRLRIALIGDGPLAGELRELAETLGIGGRVLFLGARDDVAELLPALDLFVLPSRTEGVSIALLEACASGLAVVATAVGGNPEIVEDTVTGRLVASDDAQALHALLDELLADPAQRQRLGAAARDWVRLNGSVDALRRNYDQVYREALAS